jgi:hypothetical protein
MSLTTSPTAKQSGKWLIALGALWLGLAALLLVYQLVNPTVEVRWETATELNTAGFNLYRGASREDISWLVNQSGIIPSQGEALAGAAYTYSDEAVEAGQTYYYLIEEIEYDGSRQRYEEDVFTYRVPYVTLLTAVLTTISVIIGIALMVTGLKEERNL